MPSKSASQHRFMEAAAHDPAFAKRAGTAQKVAKEGRRRPRLDLPHRPRQTGQDRAPATARAATRCLAYKRVNPERHAR
jgi:hypothetical protein